MEEGNTEGNYSDNSPSQSESMGLESKDSDEPVRTLFVSGLPSDVKLREMYNLFRPYEGFISASLNYTGEKKTPVSFVLFSDQNAALVARDSLQGINFEPATPNLILRIELAKSNSKGKRRRGVIGSVAGGHEDKRVKKAGYLLDPYSSYPVGGSLGQMPNLYNDIGNMYQSDYNSGYPYMSHDPLNLSYFSMKNTNQQARQPCSTLFVGNLGPNTSEKEIEDIFKIYPGFEMCKLTRKDDSVMCFVDFQNVQCSTRAMNALQGIILHPTERGGIRVEYAKNRMSDAIKNSK